MTAPDQALYARSYLVMRFAIATAALTMPVFVILGTLAIEGDARGSLSEYYHGPMRDFFVGALWAVGLLLITYRVTEPRTWEFRVSSVTGFGAIVLSFFPAARPGAGSDRGCDHLVEGRPCTAIQQILTETGTLALHVVGTVLFLVGAVVMCVIWARAATPERAQREAADVAGRFGVDAARLAGSKRMSRVVYVVSAVVMTVALLFQVAIGFPFDVPYALLVVELVCIGAFGVSWLAESRALLTALAGRSDASRRFAEARLAMAEPVSDP